MTLQLAKPRFLLCGAIVYLVSVAMCNAQTGTDFDKATTEFHAGNYGAAAALFARAESSSPGKTAALLYKAKSLVHLQNFAEAEAALRRYILSHPDSDDALYLLGFVLHRENHPAESLEIYTKAAAIKTPTGDDLKIVGLTMCCGAIIRMPSNGWRRPSGSIRRTKMPGIF